MTARPAATDNAAMKTSDRKPPSASASVRFGQRVPVDVHVGLRLDGREQARGIIRNASISGALIATSLELPLNANLVVTLAIPGRNPLALDACVVRLDPDGLGIEWRDMGSVDIVDLLEHAS
jgi:hypothetical protein